MNHPAISVIIPAYNASKWLPAAVDSVLAQTFTDWELIIVNDGSTDHTLETAYSFNDARIRVVDQANAGVSAARNAGITASVGNYLCFLDADDTMLPNNLAVKHDQILSHKVDWVFADIAICDENLTPTGHVLKGTDGDVLRTLLLQARPSVPLSCGNVLMSRNCLGSSIRLDEHLSNAADQDLTMQLALQGKHLHVPQVLGMYRNVAGSMSKDVELYQADHLRMFRNAKGRGLLSNHWFRRQCMANVYWAIGGSWWMLAKRPFKAIPFLVRAVAQWPAVVVRPVRKRTWASTPTK